MNAVLKSVIITIASIVTRTRPKVVMWLGLMKVLSNFIWIPWSRNQSLVGKVPSKMFRQLASQRIWQTRHFCNFPHLLLVFPQRQTHVETMGEQSTQASHQELNFKEVITLKPHADNTDQQEVSYTLIAFTVFSESCTCMHYRVYCQKGDTDWYLFDDDKITKKRHGNTSITKRNNIAAQVSSLYYLKNDESTIKKSAENFGESQPLIVDNLAHSQMRGGEVAEGEQNRMRTEEPTSKASETINGAFIFIFRTA